MRLCFYTILESRCCARVTGQTGCKAAAFYLWSENISILAMLQEVTTKKTKVLSDLVMQERGLMLRLESHCILKGTLHVKGVQATSLQSGQSGISREEDMFVRLTSDFTPSPNVLRLIIHFRFMSIVLKAATQFQSCLSAGFIIVMLPRWWLLMTFEIPQLSLCVSMSFWLKCLDNYWIDCNEFWCRCSHQVKHL